MGRTHTRTRGGLDRTQSAFPVRWGRRTRTPSKSPVRPSAGAVRFSVIQIIAWNERRLNASPWPDDLNASPRSKGGSLPWGAVCGGRGPRPFTLSGDFES